MNEDNSQNMSDETELSPLSAPENVTPVTETPTETKRSPTKKFKRYFIGFVGLVLVAAIAVTAYYFLVAVPNNKTNIFYRALEKSYSTTSFQKTMTYGASDQWLVTKANLVANNQPLLQSNFTVRKYSSIVSIQSVANNQDIYHYVSVDEAKNPDVEKLSNKYYAIRQGGAYDSQYTNTPVPQGGLSYLEQVSTLHFEKVLFDPRMSLFGTNIVGNFTAEQKEQLLKYIRANNIYTFDEKKVETTTLDGKAVYKFPVTINQVQLANLNRMAASYFGISINELDARDWFLARKNSADFYVDKSSLNIVKVVDSDPYFFDIVTYYSDFDAMSYISAQHIIAPESYTTFADRVNKICQQKEVYAANGSTPESSLCKTLITIFSIY